ncbi:MAG: two-component system OmpR family sensor kinase [Planctomycetota bacterium]|jgi:two-component system OmpR family sensor kinase
MNFRSLYSKLSITLFVLLCLIGLLLNQIIQHSGVMYQQQVSQTLNANLARHIVEEETLIKSGEIDKKAVDVLFDKLMAVNPGVEIYLLDPTGVVVDYFAADSSIKRMRIELDPIRQFLDQKSRFPVFGDDPRSSDQEKIFSVAEITDANGLQGYLYVIIEGEKYDGIVAQLTDSYVFDSALYILLAALAVALTVGLLVFAGLTRRLRKLGAAMRGYAAQKDIGEITLIDESLIHSNDEVGQLADHFRIMADRIDEQFRHLRRMDGMRRELVANVSHDLRTPLTTMRGYLETLLINSGKLSTEEERQYLETALSHSKRLAELIDELFELARLDSCESVVYSEAFSMAELVQDVGQSFELRARKTGVSLDLDINPQTPLIYGDIAMMQRVLENLLENGFRHTPKGGHITIAVDIESSQVVVKIADTGCGISADDVPRIFERFYMPKTNNQSSSSGLGLAIVKRILELHGSVIKVRSQLNQGTTFSFSMDPVPSI